MKAAIFALACILLAGPAFAGRSLSQFTAGTCAVYGSLSVVVKHGSCSGFAKAQCTTFAEAESVIDEQLGGARTFDLCDLISVTEKAEAIATAIAEVYVESLAKVECDGLGFGCGFSVAAGDSFATAYARSFARAAALAFGDGLSSVCVADLEAFAAGIADVAASSNVKACVNGSGSAEAFRSEFVEAATKLLTEAIVTVTAEVCVDGNERAECSAEVTGSSEGDPFTNSTTVSEDTVVPGDNPFDGENTATGSTTSTSDSRKIKPCEGAKNAKCCQDPEKNICQFGLFTGAINETGNRVLINFFGKPVCWCH